MKQAHLNQKIRLRWGEAKLLAQAIATVLYGEAAPSHWLVPAGGPLARVRRRLAVRAATEVLHTGLPVACTWRLTLHRDEVAALMLLLPVAPAAGGAWGEIQRVSLLLARQLDASAGAVGPAACH